MIIINMSVKGEMVMFEEGVYVLNAKNGICKIEGVVHLDASLGEGDRPYYLLVPVEETSAKVYIPVDGAEQRMRTVIGEEMAWQVIDAIPEIEELMVENDKERERQYKEAIQSCKPEALVSIIKSMYLRKQKRIAQGKKSTAVDEKYFKIAENNLYAELAFALGKPKQEMQKLIGERIKKSS